ncbi:MAG: hypothetical protein K8R56_09100, partial [Candidatus Eisenbacteria bacterium]|nr:hypothetical protein [Candidatus Eisenbacteria bacterium]
MLTAGVALPTIQLGILGIPQGFTPVEIESWLRDLAGVALETSRSDQRPRPIPALLHHALTGLLFSQSELWSHTGQALPCSAVFVDGPLGTAFGWVGSARVMLLVNGEPFEPQWVIVRDEAGREAMSAMLPRDVHVMLTLEYRPNGEDGSASPASMDAECGLMPDSHASLAPTATREPAPAPSAPVPAPINELAPLPTPTPAPPLSPLPLASALPVDQPGLAPDPAALPLDRPDVAQALPSTHHPSSSTFAMPKLPGAASAPSAESAPVDAPVTHETEASLTLTPSTPPPDGPTPDQLPSAPAAMWTPTQPPVAPAPIASASPVAESPVAASEPPAMTPPKLTPFDARDRATPDEHREEPKNVEHREELKNVEHHEEFKNVEHREEPKNVEHREEPTSVEHREEPRHPVGRWLSKMLGFGKRTHAPEPEPVSNAPLSSYDALLGDKASATPEPASEPTPPATREPVLAQESLALPTPAVDISEPRPLSPSAEVAPVSVPTPPALKRGGLAPAGLSDILGTQPIKPVVKPLEGLTGSFSPSVAAEVVGSVPAPPESLGTPLYPILDVDVPKDVVAQPVVIDHEPVGAAENFDIPPVPEREIAPHVEPAAVVPSAPEPVPAPVEPVVASEPAPVASEPTPPADPELPEPPADFLAEFAASMETVEPAAPAPAPTPLTGPPVLRVATPPKPPAVPTITPVAQPETVASAPPAPTPVAPAAPSMPTFVPAGPPAGVAPTPGGPPARPTMAFLRIPTAADPVPVVPAEQSGMMREIPLPSRSAEMRNPLREAAAPAAAPASAEATATRQASSASDNPNNNASDVQSSDAPDAAPDGMLVATAATP